MEDRHPGQHRAWLDQFPEVRHALSRLSPAAQERFFLQLRFEDGQLQSFSLDELQPVLSPRSYMRVQLEIMRSLTPAELHPTLEEQRLASPAEGTARARSSGFIFSSGSSSRTQSTLTLNGVCAEPWDLPTLLSLERENLLIVFSSLLPPMELIGAPWRRREYLPIFLNALKALETRRLATPRRLRLAQAALLGAGLHDQARELARQHPKAGLTVIPPMRDLQGTETSAPSAWMPARIKRATGLKRVPLDLSDKRWWVVCSITYATEQAERLATTLRAPELRQARLRFGGWITVQLGFESLQAVLDWNHRHPRLPVWPAGKREDWAVADWAEPNIVIVEDDKVVYQTPRSWWSGPDGKAKLVALLRSHELMQPTS